MKKATEVRSQLLLYQSRQIMLTICNRVTALYVGYRNSERAQGYTEYVILLALIALVAYSAVKFFGNQLTNGLFDQVSPSV
jgi:Flp pilus assembly pilin Flp